MQRGEFRYRDGQTGQSNELLLDKVELLADQLSDPITLAIAGSLDGNAIEADGQTGSVNDIMAGQALPVTLNANAMGVVAAVEGGIADPQNVSGLDLSVNVDAENFGGLQPLAAGQELPVTLDQVGPLALAAKVTGSPDQLTISDLDLALDALGAALRGTGQVSLAAGAADTGVDLSLTADDLSQLATALNASIPNEPLSLTARIEGNPSETININDLDFTFGPNDLSGQAQIALTGVRPEITAELASQMMDVNVLAGAGAGASGQEAPSDEQDTTQESGGSGRIFSEEPIAVDGLEAVDADIAMTFGTLQMPNVTMTDVEAKLVLQDGKLDLAPFDFNVADTRPSITLALAKAGEGLDFGMTADATALNWGMFLAEYGITNLLEGNGDIDIDLKASGGSLAALAGSLDGSVTALIDEGRMRTEMIDQWLAGLGGAVDTLLNNTDGQWIVVDCLALDVLANQGVLTPATLMVNTKLSVITGGGEINLGSEQLGLSIAPQLKAGGLPLPHINFTGALAAPSFGLGQIDASNIGGGLAYAPQARNAFQEMGIQDDDDCLTPEVTAIAGNLGDLAKQPEKALEALTGDGDAKKALEDTGKSLLNNLLGGN